MLSRHHVTGRDAKKGRLNVRVNAQEWCGGIHLEVRGAIVIKLGRRTISSKACLQQHSSRYRAGLQM